MLEPRRLDASANPVHPHVGGTDPDHGTSGRGRTVGCPLCGAAAGTRLWLRHGFEWLRCPVDGMVWVSPQLSPEAVVAAYDAGHAAKSAGLGGAARPVPAKYRQTLQRMTALAGGRGRLLEVGAFDGLFLEAAHQAGWDASGTEVNAAAAAEATRRGFPMHIGPLTSAQLAPASLDAVILRDVIEHLPEPMADLRRLAGWTRPGGVLYVWTPNFDSLTRRLYGQHWGAVVFPWHFSYFTAATLSRMLAASGFQVVNLASRNLLLRRADPYLASVGLAPTPAGPASRRLERILARAANPVFAALDGWGRHWGAQLEVFAIRQMA